jgi:hypothetical protein
MHIQDGVCTQGTCDAVLPSDEWTDQAFGWADATGWCTGPGYRTEQRRSDDGGATWYPQTPDLGPGRHFIGSGADCRVRMCRC